MTFANQVKHNLLQNILAMVQFSWLFSKNPETDFSWNRKIDFQSLLHFCICMEASTTRHELRKFFPMILLRLQTRHSASSAINFFQKLSLFYSSSLILITHFPCIKENTSWSHVIKTSLHTIGAINFHSKKREYIEMEVWACLLLYNFCSIITGHVVIKQKSTKHIYQVNYTVAYQTWSEL